MRPWYALILTALLTACDGDGDGSDDKTPVDSTPDETDVVDTGDSPETDAAPETDPPEETGDTGVVDTDDGLPQDAVIDCPDVTPAVSSGTCDVLPGAGDSLLYRGDVLGRFRTWRDGGVLVGRDGRITCVGCDCLNTPEGSQATVVACPGAAISPGLINTHDHLTFSENAPFSPTTTRYEHRHDWRSSSSPAVDYEDNPHGTGSTSDGNRWVELRQVLGGATTVVGSGWARGMMRNPDEGEDEGIDLAYVENETFPLGDSSRRSTGSQFRPNCGWEYRDDARYVATQESYVPHVAEGIDYYANEEFRCLATAFDGGEDLTEANAAHIHLVGLTAEDAYELARNDTTAIWSPRTNIFLYGNTAPVTLFDTLGARIALGTDWSWSGSATMVRELACADQLNRDHYAGHFSDADLWRMATANAAHALGADDLSTGRDGIGVLAPGYVADVAVFDGADASLHRAVIDADSEDVVLVMRGREPLYGEADTLAELGDPCDAVDVCGSARAVCSAREYGVTYSTLAARVGGAYPAFSCPTWDDEPTCVPSRPGEYDGVGVAGDQDGDGKPDAEDLCPDVFDPVRPMDEGVQPDRDGDGVGDACDPTPIPADLDGDGVDNALDVCPRVFDDQTDTDGDGRGDACDVCPDDYNPFGVCPSGPVMDLVTVKTTMTPGVGSGPGVVVEGVVTGVGSSGFTMQDPAVLDGRDAGIYVFTGGSPGVARGERVQVDGEYTAYFDEGQITGAFVTSLGATTPVAPIPVTVADAATEAYEGVLVELIDGTVTDADYDCAVDGSCSDPGLWEVGGPTGVVVFDRLYEDSDWTGQIGTLPVTGVMGWRWNRRRLMPRESADFGP